MKLRLAFFAGCIAWLVNALAGASLIQPRDDHEKREACSDKLLIRNAGDDACATKTAIEFLEFKTNCRGQGHGVNTLGKPLWDTTDAAPLRLEEVPLVKVGNIFYRQFILHIEEFAPKPTAINLDSLHLDLGDGPNLTACQLGGGHSKLVFDLGPDHPVLHLHGDAEHCVSRQSFVVDVPAADFQPAAARFGHPYVYFDSSMRMLDRFGHCNVSWSVGTSCVPEPASMGLLATGLNLLLRRGKRRTTAQTVS